MAMTRFAIPRGVQTLIAKGGWIPVAALAAFATACSAPATSGPDADFSFLPEYLPGWENYEVVDNASFDLSAVEGELTPFSLAQSLMITPETMECFGVSQVRVAAVDEETYAVLASQVGLCDDSVAAIEQRIDLTPTPAGWMLDQAGIRYGCARPTFAWATPGTLCP